MSRIIESVEVDVPVRVAYEGWTRFESLPRFIDGVDRVVQLDETTIEWHATVDGEERAWRAEIVEQRPDDIVAWRSTEGAHNDGAVRFEALGPDRTRVILQLDQAPGWIESTAAPTDVASAEVASADLLERRVRGDLARFRELIESGARIT